MSDKAEAALAIFKSIEGLEEGVGAEQVPRPRKGGSAARVCAEQGAEGDRRWTGPRLVGC